MQQKLNIIFPYICIPKFEVATSTLINSFFSILTHFGKLC